ncbi:hypothetical protein DKX38_019784 [Salix brachista]|uniref:Retrotransposon gag domain-containing protein n=1 Tax=Salix brachista TaxID=2182728 RepID=A0A5N5KH56_9ROSI|nr:hypothetical protein DKX38_019784 [Salix brachista]
MDVREKASREAQLRMAAMVQAKQARAETHARAEILEQEHGVNPDEMMNGWGGNAQRDEKEPSEDFLNDEETKNGDMGLHNEWREGSSKVDGIKVYQRRGRSARIADVDAADVDAVIELKAQFDTFMKMYQEHRQHDRIEKEQLSARIEELSRDLSATRTETRQGDDGSANRNPRDYHQEGQRQDGRLNLPRYSRLEFPLYDGKQDPLAWLSRCDHFFRHQHIPEAEKVEIASYHLDEDAQMTTVEDYQRKFEQLAARAGPLTTEQELEIFISGLQEYIAIEVELHSPRDLTSAMSLAHLYERRGGLPCEPKAGLQVMVANGEKIRSPGQCLDVPVTMGNQLIHIDFYILNLTGIDAVLGVNWLQTLGPILWDFAAKTMVFKLNGRVMELQGTEVAHSPTPVMLQNAESASTLQTDLESLISLGPSSSVLTQGEIHPLPKVFLDSRVMHNKPQVLVHWEGLSPADSFWEDTTSFRCKFPSFALVDKCHFNGRSDVMHHVDKGSSKVDGIKVYQRRGRSARIADVDAAIGS